MARDLDITVNVIDNDAHQKLVVVDRDIDKLGTTAKAQTGFLDDLSAETLLVATGFIGATAAMTAFSTGYQVLKQFIGESVTAFSEAEQAESRLVAALRQHSLATPEVIAQYNALGTTFQRTTIYADDEIQAMEALLTQVGGVMPSKMAGALKASTDLAAGLGMDLHTATNLVAKAAAGHTETLGRYGITVSQAALETKGFDAVLEAVNRQFGGQAEAALDTYAGKLKQMGNAWNNFQEVVGKFIVQNAFVEQGLHVATEAMAHLDDTTSGTSVSVTDLWKAANLPAPLVVAWLETYVSELIEAWKYSELINRLPRPFENMMAVLPPITAGMTLFNAQLAEHERQVRADIAAEKAMAAAMTELNSVGGKWFETINEIDGEVVAAIRYYLDAGVSQHALATAYGLTAAQIKAVATAMSEELATAKVLHGFLETAAKNQAALDNAAMKAIDDKIMKMIQAQQAAEKANADFLRGALEDAQAQDKLNGIIAQTPTQIDKIPPAFNAATASAQAFHDVLDGIQLLLVNTDLGAALPTLGGPGQGATRPRITGQTRDAGGPVSAGQSYLVGRGAQPELFTPSENGFMTPRGAGGGSMIVHVNVTQPLGSPMAIANAVRESLVQFARTSGQRVG